jgi:hypothetical protein
MPETMKKSVDPPGWNERRVAKVIAHYESQTDDEAVAEDEAVFGADAHTVMEVPTVLVPVVRALIARHRARRRARGR